ncbi:MAG: riboflavin synthase [Ignavibacteriae bacterium]|nr:MAG: riboflavin synthase [Ignavibacteriota bacterium]
MFSGIVEELGKVTAKIKIPEGYRFRIKGKKAVKKLKISDSISINGVCHTVVKKAKDEFEIVSMHETLKKTNIGELEKNAPVNLENSLRIGGELGGHFVFGHIDDTGVITAIKQIKGAEDKKDSDNWEYWIKVHKKHRQFVIYVGSIAIDGVSLTVAEIKPVKGNYFELKVAIIPYTYKVTNFGNYKVGDRVNIEFDFLGKYVQNILNTKINQK